jgi:hypothetical protein
MPVQMVTEKRPGRTARTAHSTAQSQPVARLKTTHETREKAIAARNSIQRQSDWEIWETIQWQQR